MTRPSDRSGPYSARQGLTAALLLVLAPSIALAQGGDPNACDAPGDTPDVIVGSLHSKTRHGTLGGVTAFSIGTTSCNVGSCWLNWFAETNQHPVIGQNMFRLKDGRFEQIGQSWLKHGFFALSDGLCSSECLETDGDHLGVNCSDPYSAFLNGMQDNLGPKFEVNPSTGHHPHPVTDQALTGNVVFKRLQVQNSDLDPTLNAGALYFVEGQYVAQDDATAGNGANNASYRKVTVSGAGSVFDIAFDGPTQQQMAGIRAWADVDSGVEEVEIEVPGDGLFILAAKVTPNGNGSWHYEYAIQNLTSHRAARTFSVPIPAGVTLSGIGFQDADYHSGEPFAATDWATNGGAGFQLTWSAPAFAENANANALRWGTLYNFRFDANVPPASNPVRLGLFRPGVQMEIVAVTLTPSLCNANGSCDPGEDCARCPAECANGSCELGETACGCALDCGGPPPVESACGNAFDDDCDQFFDCFDGDCCGDAACAPPDADGDAFVGCGDCAEGDPGLWATPGPVAGLLLAKGQFGTVLTWSPVATPGATSVNYEVLRARAVDDFVLSTACIQPATAGATQALELATPASGLFAYLVRATNECPSGVGTLGAASDGTARVGRSCGP